VKTRAFGLLAVAVTAFTVAPARALTSPGELGPELDLSAGDVSAERPAVAHRSGPNGYDNFIVVWKAHDLAGDSIRARFVEKVGSNVVPGAPFTVKGALVGVTLSAPAVAMDNTGRFTIAWGEARALQSCVIVRRFGPQAQPLPSPVVESCQPGSTGTLEAPQVAAGSNAGGEVAVGWTRRIAADRHRLLMRTISPAGALRPTGVVSTNAGSDPRPRLAVGGGQVFVVWQNPLAMVRRFSIAGVALAGAAQLPAYGGHHPVVGSNRNGQFAAAWAEAASGSIRRGSEDGNSTPRGTRCPTGSSTRWSTTRCSRTVTSSVRTSPRIGWAGWRWSGRASSTTTTRRRSSDGSTTRSATSSRPSSSPT
jgi:hypothetical protein